MNIITSNFRYIVRLTLTLFIITAIVALMLAGVNAVTVDRIAQLELEAKNAAMAEVMPDTTIDESKTIENEDSTVYYAMREGELAGFCVEVAPSGFGGEISMIVGVDMGYKVTGISIISMSETPGLGTRAQEPDFLNQFVGRGDSAPFEVGSSGEGSIDAISAATITSKAVTLGVNTALDAAADAINRGE